MFMQHVWAMVVRHIKQLTHDMPRLLSIFYWPFLDIMLFGYFAIWTQTMQSEPSEVSVKVTAAILASTVLWQIVVRANFDISLNLLEEIWSANMTNLFASPLTITEWIASSILFASIMFWIVTIFCALVVFFAYGFNILTVGWWLVPLALNLFMCGLAIGFGASALLFYSGVRAQNYIYMIGWVFVLFSGLYYPVDILPFWVQKIAYTLPFVYLFNSLRELIISNTISYYTMVYATGMSVAYFSVTVIFFKVMFEKSREKGLALLTD